MLESLGGVGSFTREALERLTGGLADSRSKSLFRLCRNKKSIALFKNALHFKLLQQPVYSEFYGGNMDIIRGLVVKSKAGRDKGCFFVVLDFDENYAIISDGKRRTILNPKKKKLKHLSVTGTKLVESSMLTDRGIRKALNEFK